ncbi:MAG: hypothetical protein CML99_06700 [Rhodobiaceae bacterium]|nr:hypothetical protein [Rhodobiaceae bacterium]
MTLLDHPNKSGGDSFLFPSCPDVVTGRAVLNVLLLFVALDCRNESGNDRLKGELGRHFS